MADNITYADNRGLYNMAYYSGSQAAVYIGDVWVDDINFIEWTVQQTRKPLYGYNDQLFRDVAKGQVLIQGSFRINFREAGYLFLVLDRYRTQIGQKPSMILAPDVLKSQTLEGLRDGTLNRKQVTDILTTELLRPENDTPNEYLPLALEQQHALLGGFGSRLPNLDPAKLDDDLMAFESAIWGTSEDALDNLNAARRADHPEMNPFDIFVTFGEQNTTNSTVQRLTSVHIVGSHKEIGVGAEPIQEVYTFIARNVL